MMLLLPWITTVALAFVVIFLAAKIEAQRAEIKYLTARFLAMIRRP